MPLLERNGISLDCHKGHVEFTLLELLLIQDLQFLNRYAIIGVDVYKVQSIV